MNPARNLASLLVQAARLDPGRHHVLHPAASQAGHIEWLYWFLFWILFAVFVLMIAFFTRAGAKARVVADHPLPVIEHDEEGERRAGWAVGSAFGIMVITLFVILVVSVVTGKHVEGLTSKNPVTIQITGHQWWWEVTYPNPQADQTVTTANEIHVPVGTPIVVLANSKDVIHSFWAPNITGKRDLLPGYSSAFSFQIDKPGTYHGQCAEFCGLQHAHMGFSIIAESVAEFQAWQQQQLKSADEPSSPEATRGREVFLTHACLMCHTIRGTDAGSRLGPDLTHVASRNMIAAETLPNTAGALAGWVVDPQRIKPGTQMSPNPLSGDDLQDVVTYLQSLQVMLAELGENLIKANSGREALDLLLKTDVAVVLMDVSMPELDGFELAGIIRQHPRFQKTAIIFISAVHLTDPDRLKGYQRGAVDYLSVPVAPELLRAKVSVFAELHRKAVQLENLNRELRRLSTRLMTAQDEERRRFARDLHDGIGQELAAAKIMLDGFLQQRPVPEKGKAIAEASEIVDRAIQQVRSLSHLLHPPLLDEGGLFSALRWFLEGMTARTGIQTSLDLQPPDFPRMAPHLERAVFRIVQEALTNVFRHSQARNACVTLVQKENSLLLAVQDDGKGVPELTAQLRPGSIGVGIGGMRERARELGGELRIANANPGTTVEILIPSMIVNVQDSLVTA